MRSNLRKLMEDKDVTVRWVSERSGVAIQTVMNARDDKKILSCSLGKLQAIAQTLGCQVKDLFEEEEAKP